MSLDPLISFVSAPYKLCNRRGCKVGILSLHRVAWRPIKRCCVGNLHGSTTKLADRVFTCGRRLRHFPQVSDTAAGRSGTASRKLP